MANAYSPLDCLGWLARMAPAFGVRSKRRKISTNALRVVNPRGSFATSPIGLFSNLHLPITIQIIDALDFDEKVDFTSLVAKGFRSKLIRNNESLWSRYPVNLTGMGASLNGTTRKLDTLVLRPGVVQELSVRTIKGSAIGAKEVIKMLMLPQLSYAG